MTDSTKQLFDAPWRIHKTYPNFVLNSNYRIVSECGAKDANRIARLPEMYEALVETTYAKCYSCHIQKEQKPTTKNRSDYIENGCTFHKDNCYFQKVWELLRKVRDGE